MQSFYFLEVKLILVLPAMRGLYMHIKKTLDHTNSAVLFWAAYFCPV